MTELTDDEINDVWAAASEDCDGVDMVAYGHAIVKALNDKKCPPETDRDWVIAQDWKGMDGAIAFHLIERHADGWGDVGAMMDAWRAANPAASPLPAPMEPK